MTIPGRVGTTSVAAPNAASSSVARYSFTARLARSAPRSLSQSLPGIDHWRLLSPAELDLIRQQVEGFDRIYVIDDEMRELIESQRPDLASRLPPREPS